MASIDSPIVKGLFAAAAFAWSALAWLVSSFVPENPLALACFYALLYLALATTVSLATWSVKRVNRGDEPQSPLFWDLSHGMLFSSIALFALWLQSLRMLTPLNAALLLAIFTFMELMVMALQRAADE